MDEKFFEIWQKQESIIWIYKVALMDETKLDHMNNSIKLGLAACLFS
jgi:hypothetical protein